tara:strand:+ start:793 stop:1029 length:237 start_codon:yes stop_codon:yes gene_type:complete
VTASNKHQDYRSLDITQFNVRFERYVLNGETITRMMEVGFPHPLLQWRGKEPFEFNEVTLHAIASAWQAGIGSQSAAH